VALAALLPRRKKRRETGRKGKATGVISSERCCIDDRLRRAVLRVHARVTDRPFYFGIEQTELNLWKFDKIPSAGARNHGQNEGTLRVCGCMRALETK